MGMEKVLQSIKKAEQAAEKTLSDAQSESSRILSDARRDAADLVAKATEEAQAAIQSTLDAAKGCRHEEREERSERRRKSGWLRRIRCKFQARCCCRTYCRKITQPMR